MKTGCWRELVLLEGIAGGKKIMIKGGRREVDGIVWELFHVCSSVMMMRGFLEPLEAEVYAQSIAEEEDEKAEIFMRGD